MSRRACRGFTLIELVIVITVLAIALSGMTAVFAEVVRSADTTASIDIAAQVGNQCAEHVLGQRQRNPAVGFNGYDGNACAGLAFGAYTVTDTVTALSGGLCPAGARCKRVDIAVSGPAVRSFDVLLVDY